MDKVEVRLELAMLDLLKDEQWHHALELSDITPRYSAVVERLRAWGYDILTLPSRIPGEYAQYKLVGVLSEGELRERMICKLENSNIRMERAIEKNKAILNKLKNGEEFTFRPKSLRSP